MVSVMDVDMAAALLVASHEKAEALGVPADRRVYLRGWAYGNDPWYVAEHPELWRSEAMKQVSGAALTMAGAGIDEVAHIDLYSCFASLVLVAREAAQPKKAITDSYAGRATIATYTVAHGRGGGAEWGLAVCDLDDGTRCYAKMLDPDHLAQAEADELVGTTVSLVPGDNNANVV